jgi:putative transcriptional regulator
MDSLRHHFLIAMPHLQGDIFTSSLTYICEHNEEGALGLIINKPLPVKLSEILLELDVYPSPESERVQVLAGGPVSTNQGFILHNDPDFQVNSLRTGPETYLTTSKEMLFALTEHRGPNNFLITLGYAGWDAGQLEEELANNAWITCPAQEDILFNLDPEEKLSAATRTLGIDPDQLCSDIGHA